MKKYRIFAAAAAVCLLLSGCSGLSLNDSEILTPPKADTKQSQIQEIIRQRSDNRGELIYPESGEYTRPVVFRDLWGSQDEEAVAFYSDGSGVKVLIAGKSGSGYKVLNEAALAADRITRAEFADLDGDGHDEIIVSYPDGNELSLCVLSAESGRPQSDDTEGFSEYLIADLDSDGKKDILTLALPVSAELTTARMLTYDKTLTVASFCELASDVTAYTRLSFGDVGDGVMGAVVDAENAAGEISTQIIYYEPSTAGLLNPLFVNTGYTKTRRPQTLSSTDVDRDGVIEIPLCEVMDYAPVEDEEAVCRKICWSCYDFSQLQLVTKKSAILCDRLGFLLNMTGESENFVTARYLDSDKMAVYLWEYKNDEATRTTKLLTIRRAKAGATPESGEKLLAHSDDADYYYVIENPDSYYAYSDADVTDNFVIMDS